MGKEWDKFCQDRSEPNIRAGNNPNLRGRKRNPISCVHLLSSSRPINPPAFQAWCESWATEALRVLKPGGHLLAMGGTRTFHRLTCALEDAGLEIRDTIMWIYGSGFPKSYNISKGFDRRAFKAWLDIVELDCCLVRDPRARKAQVRKAVSAAVNGQWEASSNGSIRQRMGNGYSRDRTPSEAGRFDPGYTRERHSEGSRHLASLITRFWEPLNEIERHEIWQTIIGDHGALISCLPWKRLNNWLRARLPVRGRLYWGLRLLRWARLLRYEGCDAGMPPGVRVKVGAHPQQHLMGPPRQQATCYGDQGNGLTDQRYISAPSTPLARRFAGAGSGLKPAFEPVVVARKPLIGTLCKNAEKWGTGGLNIDKCRIGTGEYLGRPKGQEVNVYERSKFAEPMLGLVTSEPQGRWLANLILSHSEDCVRVGTKRVRGSFQGFAEKQRLVGYHHTGELDIPAQKGYTDPDGYEQVEDWICVKLCPVRLLGDSARYFKNIDPGQETRVDNSVFLWYNKKKQEVNQCYENVNIAIRNSMPEKQMSSEASGDSVGGSADTQAEENGARSTRGFTFPAKMGGDINAGAKLEAGSNFANLKAAGCGNGNMAQSPKDMKSTIEMATIPTTPLRTCNLWPRVGMTTIISDCGRIIEISQELNIDDASDAKNTNHLPASTREAQERTLDTVKIAAANICENGVTITESVSMPIKENMPGNERPLRFCYAAKASRAERTCQGTIENKEPTVKPVNLCRYLERLVARPGAIILDPFCGSGSFGVAAVLEGFNWIGIDNRLEACQIAKKRCEWVNQQKGQPRLFK